MKRPIGFLHAACVLALGAVVAACSTGGGKSAPAPATPAVSSTAKGGLALKVDLSKFQLAKQRNPKYIGTNADTVGYSILQNGNVIVSGSWGLSSCTPNCPALPLPTGSGYEVDLTLIYGSTTIGEGGSTGVTISPGTTTPVTITMEPLYSGPTVSVPGTSAFVLGVPSSVAVTVAELDPVGNMIYQQNTVTVDNWPGISMKSSDTNGSHFTFSPSSLNAAPTPGPAATANFNYSGASPLGESAVTVSAQDGNGNTSNTVTIPIVSMTTTLASISTSGQFTTALSFTITETAPGALATPFTLSPNLGGSVACGTGTIQYTASGYNTGPGTVQNIFSVQQTSVGTPTCLLHFTSPDYPTATVTVQLN